MIDEANEKLKLNPLTILQIRKFIRFLLYFWNSIYLIHEIGKSDYFVLPTEFESFRSTVNGEKFYPEARQGCLSSQIHFAMKLELIKSVTKFITCKAIKFHYAIAPGAVGIRAWAELHDKARTDAYFINLCRDREKNQPPVDRKDILI